MQQELMVCALVSHDKAIGFAITGSSQQADEAWSRTPGEDKLCPDRLFQDLHVCHPV